MISENSRLVPEKNSLMLLVLLGFVFLMGVYWSLRFAGLVMDVDASRVTVAADGMLATGKMMYPGNYHAGYGFSAVLAFVSAVTGLSLQGIQLGSALWLVAVALAAFVAYREMLGGSRLAVFAAFLLFIQPDFLFYILRASHEKTTWLYALLLLFLAVRSYRYAGQPFRQLAFILLFYLVFFALASTNTFFASSFAAALLISFAGGWLLNRWSLHLGNAGELVLHRRLIITAISGLLIVFIMMQYIYPPSRNLYFALYDMTGKTSALMLGAQPAQPYNYVEQAWISPTIYLALTSAQWLINILAFVFWGIKLLKMDLNNRSHRLLWLIYTAFGVQLAASLVIDLSGSLSANLQVRQFTPFTLLSSPLAALALVTTWEQVANSWKRVLRPAAALLAVAAASMTMLKVTNDPLLGNQWMFYTPGERQAVNWTDQVVHGKYVLIDTTEDLYNIVSFWEGYDWKPGNTYFYGYNQWSAPYALVSRLTYLRANRSGLVLQIPSDQNQVYDNGTTQVLHRKAVTPYQR